MPRPRTHDDRTGRVFPDHLIITYLVAGAGRRCTYVAFAISSECRSVCVALVAGAGRRCTYTVCTYTGVLTYLCCALSSTGEGACVARLGVCISLISPPPPGARWRQPGRNNRAQTNILVHRCTWHAHITARFTWEQTAGGTVRTARSARDHTGTRAGSNGRRWPNGLRLLPGRPTASRNRVARGGTQGGPNCLTHALPRCLPTPTEEADGNGYGVIAGRRGPSEAAAQSER